MAPRNGQAGAHQGTPTSVVIADDNRRVRQALADLLESDPSFRVAGSAADAEEAVEVAARHRADIVVVDVRMPKGTGVRVARELAVLSPASRVLALSGYGDRKHVIQMLDAGAVGYVVKAPDLDLLAALRAVRRGEHVLSSAVTGVVVEELAGHRARTDAGLLGGARIARTIDARSFTIAFQPIFSLSEGAAVGVEALARLDPAAHIGPDLWFAEAWAVGLGAELELAVAAEAVTGARSRPAGTFLSINASPAVATDPRFLELLAGAGGDGAVVVELTEHFAVQDYAALQHDLAELRGAGVRLAVDDVGAGYASFRHVLELHPDMIKLDVSLTAEIDTDPSRRALAAGLVAVAAELGATVIAEGIETVAQLRCLTGLGVAYGQGYYLARPGPVEYLTDAPAGR